MTDYAAFLHSKEIAAHWTGKNPQTNIAPVLFPFQRDLIRWAIKKGRAALFEDTGLGKTFQQLEWARLMDEKTLIIAPLSVARQTCREAAKIDIDVQYCRDQSDVTTPISITNYEMIDHFSPSKFGAVVLDESSILKGLTSTTRRKLITMFSAIPYRLCCTATPAPNDIAEIANHAEFLGIMSRTDMLSTFFVHDQEGWRLRGHAKEAFFLWLSSWCMFLRLPSDLGYDDEGYRLPTLNIQKHYAESGFIPEGQLFATQLDGIKNRIKARKGSIDHRLQVAVQLVQMDSDQWIIWCGLNDESMKLSKLLPDAVNVQGSDSIEKKRENIEAFQDGRIRILITKGKIAGFGINLQNCHKQIFFGLNDSWELFYQCVRRSYRFGQKHPVDIHVIISDAEIDVLQNVMKKDHEANNLRMEMMGVMKNYEQQQLTGSSITNNYETETVSFRDEYKLMLGDSCERLNEVANDNVGLSIFSPPFLSLYAYSATNRDLGNSKNTDEFFSHFRFIIKQLLRITQPGRNCCVHVSQVPAMLVRDGYIGIKDFRGVTIAQFENCGWIYHGEICIDKNPQAQAIRTKSKALLFTQMRKDASWLRPALADYILVFRKPGENINLVRPEISNEQWIEWAHPVWYGINETDTLNYREARDNDDDRHICPLQLGVIERSVLLWSNRGDIICSPFMGIGSEGYVAIKHHRKFIGCELKKSYFDCAVKNIDRARKESEATLLF